MGNHYPIHDLIENRQNNSGWAGMNWGGVAGSRISPRPFGGLMAFVMATSIHREPRWCSTISPSR